MQVKRHAVFYPDEPFRDDLIHVIARYPMARADAVPDNPLDQVPRQNPSYSRVVLPDAIRGLRRFH